MLARSLSRQRVKYRVNQRTKLDLLTLDVRRAEQSPSICGNGRSRNTIQVAGVLFPNSGNRALYQAIRGVTIKRQDLYTTENIMPRSGASRTPAFRLAGPVFSEPFFNRPA